MSWILSISQSRRLLSLWRKLVGRSISKIILFLISDVLDLYCYFVLLTWTALLGCNWSVYYGFALPYCSWSCSRHYCEGQTLDSISFCLIICYVRSKMQLLFCRFIYFHNIPLHEWSLTSILCSIDVELLLVHLSDFKFWRWSLNSRIYSCFFLHQWLLWSHVSTTKCQWVFSGFSFSVGNSTKFERLRRNPSSDNSRKWK